MDRHSISKSKLRLKHFPTHCHCVDIAFYIARVVKANRISIANHSSGLLVIRSFLVFRNESHVAVDKTAFMILAKHYSVTDTELKALLRSYF